MILYALLCSLSLPPLCSFFINSFFVYVSHYVRMYTTKENIKWSEVEPMCGVWRRVPVSEQQIQMQWHMSCKMFFVIVLHDRVLKKDGKMENLPNFSGNWNFPFLSEETPTQLQVRHNTWCPKKEEFKNQERNKKNLEHVKWEDAAVASVSTEKKLLIWEI